MCFLLILLHRPGSSMNAFAGAICQVIPSPTPLFYMAPAIAKIKKYPPWHAVFLKFQIFQHITFSYSSEARKHFGAHFRRKMAAEMPKGQRTRWQWWVGGESGCFLRGWGDLLQHVHAV